MVEYLWDGMWVYADQTPHETESVEISRRVWRDPRVQGVRIFKTQVSVYKEALKRKGRANI